MGKFLVAARTMFEHEGYTPEDRSRVQCVKGSIVVNKENNANEGRLEGLPDFVWITYPGNKKAQDDKCGSKKHINAIPGPKKIEYEQVIDLKFSHVIDEAIIDEAIANGGRLKINASGMAKVKAR